MKIPKANIMLILAVLAVVFTFAWFVLLVFLEIPGANKGLIDTFSGALITVCLTSIYAYYFGSSKGSADKTDIMKNGNS